MEIFDCLSFQLREIGKRKILPSKYLSPTLPGYHCRNKKMQTLSLKWHQVDSVPGTYKDIANAL